MVKSKKAALNLARKSVKAGPKASEKTILLKSTQTRENMISSEGS